MRRSFFEAVTRDFLTLLNIHLVRGLDMKGLKFAVCAIFVAALLLSVTCGCNRINCDIDYSFTDEERAFPYWQGNVMRNEQVVIVRKNDKTTGRLLYPALKVIAVYDYELKTAYTEGKDYVVHGDVITLPQGSRIPVFDDEWSRGINVPAEYPLGDFITGYEIVAGECHSESKLFYGAYIHVTYVYDSSKIEKSAFTKYNDKLELGEMLKNVDKLKLAIYGDSISFGNSSSSSLLREPNQPSYAEIVAGELKRKTQVDVEMKNFSQGGTSCVWAAKNENVDRVANFAPDICLISFGVNDGTEAFESGMFVQNIRTVIDRIRESAPDCRIVLVAPFPCNAAYKPQRLQEMNATQLQDITNSGDYRYIACADVYSPCKEMLNKKHYYELAANNINHPNDFVHRLYAMSVLSVMFDYSK